MATIGLVGKPAGHRLRLYAKNPALATGKASKYSGQANRKHSLKMKQRIISLFGCSARQEIKKKFGLGNRTIRQLLADTFGGIFNAREVLANG